MGELPAFLTGIPEETLNLQKESNEPVRIFTTFTGALSGVSTGDELIFQVPEGHVLEIRHINTSAINGSGISKLFEVSTAQALLQTDIQIHAFILDHDEHQVVDSEFNPLTLLVRENNHVKLTISFSGGALNMNTLKVAVLGYLIPIQELQTKTSIII